MLQFFKQGPHHGWWCFSTSFGEKARKDRHVGSRKGFEKGRFGSRKDRVRERKFEKGFEKGQKAWVRESMSRFD